MLGVVKIRLTEVEQRIANHVGRSVAKSHDQLKHLYKNAQDIACDKSSEELNMIGNSGELAVSKWLGVYWHPQVHSQDDVVNRRKFKDCANLIDVKTTRYEKGHLALSEQDTSGPVVSVVQHCVTTDNVVTPTGEYSIRGWVMIEQGKSEKYHLVWRNVMGAKASQYPAVPKRYFVPVEELHPLESLLRYIEEKATISILRDRMRLMK